MLGTFVLSAGYYDAYFTKAQQVRRLLKEHISMVFRKFDAVILPTCPTTAFNIGEKDKTRSQCTWLIFLLYLPTSLAYPLSPFHCLNTVMACLLGSR